SRRSLAGSASYGQTPTPRLVLALAVVAIALRFRRGRQGNRGPGLGCARYCRASAAFTCDSGACSPGDCLPGGDGVVVAAAGGGTAAEPARLHARSLPSDAHPGVGRRSSGVGVALADDAG